MALFTNEKLANPNFVQQVTPTSATGGSATAPPAAPVGYITIQVNGVAAKIPYYAV